MRETLCLPNDADLVRPSIEDRRVLVFPFLTPVIEPMSIGRY